MLPSSLMHPKPGFKGGRFEEVRVWFEMTLNYWVIVDRYPFLNGVFGGLIIVVKSSLYLTGEKKKKKKKS